MPPSPRKRFRRSPTPVFESESEFGSDSELTSSSRDHSPASRSRSLQSIPILPATKGFLALPPELTYQILSHFKEIRTEHILGCTNYINDSIPEDLSARFKALRALSQLSRLSRSIFLPLLWERFQVCLACDSDWRWEWHNSIGKAMERKCKGLLESGYIWSYVKIVTVPICWPLWTRNFEALSSFAQLLEMLPNVHTLEVLRTGSLIPQSLEACFRGKIFPSIQKVVLPTRAHEILRCCSKVRDVTCNEGDGGPLVSALVHTGRSNIEILRGVMVRPTFMKRLGKVKPSLKCIRINGKNKDLTEDVFSALLVFRSLRTIEIECFENKKIELEVKYASEVLRKCAEHTEVTKSWNLRRTTKNARPSNPRSINPEPRSTLFR
ncbi:unnamed protein product [Rhizoctonia solani]|uniref:Uncharacterized protein n=1 Tax=Rhizoctonia solani TaxID=456999 RepID=A0A8H3C8I1_9AGAM|nr:unnamed protein product [Rhizoctonia solani]